MEKRDANRLLRKEFYARHAVGIKTIKPYIREVAREIHQLYRDSGGKVPYDASEDGAAMFSQGQPWRGRGRGGGRGRGFGRGRGRGKGRGGGRGFDRGSRNGASGDKEESQNESSKGTPKDAVPKSPCHGCGGLHFRENCPYRDKECYKCGYNGHIAKHCKGAAKNGEGLSNFNASSTSKTDSDVDKGTKDNDGEMDDKYNAEKQDAPADATDGDHMYAGFTSSTYNSSSFYPSVSFVSLSRPAQVTYNDGYIDAQLDEITASPYPVDFSLFGKPILSPARPPAAFLSSVIPEGYLGIDSCANRFIISSRESYAKYRAIDANLVSTGGSVPVKGIGRVPIFFLGTRPDGSQGLVNATSDDCEHVPSASVNLAPVSGLAKMNIFCHFEADPPYMQFEDLRIPLEIINGIYCARIHAPSVHTKASFYSDVPKVPDLRLWHRRFMHTNIHALRKSLLRAGVDIDLLSNNVDHCDPCWQTKFDSTKLKVDPIFKTIPERPREILHMDFLVAPCEAIGGYKYGLILIDVGCKHVAVCPAKKKDGAYVANLLQNAMVNDGGFPSIIVIDRDSPFTSNYFKDWCGSRGIQYKRVPQARHEFNGLAENVIKVLQSRITSALVDAQLPKSFWMYALLYSALVRNRVAHSKLEWMSPYELKTGKVPPVSELRTFGCVVYKRANDAGKFDPRAVLGIFVGIDVNSTHGTYIIYNPETRAASTRFIQDVRFNEDMTWHQYTLARDRIRKLPPSSDADVAPYFGAMKDLTPDQRKQHAAVLTEEELKATTTALTTIQIKRPPSEHQLKPMDSKTARRVAKKQREKALAAGEPLNYADIANHPEKEKWYDACKLEDDKQIKIGTYDFVEQSNLPEGSHVADCKRVFKKKRNGILKVRNTMKGNRQRTRLLHDFASPVIQPIVVSLALQIAVTMDWDFATFDVETAFLNADLPSGSEFYMRLPDGHPKRETHFARLKKAIYGMKEAGRLFFELLRKVLLAAGFKQSSFDPCLFYNASGLLLAHVDDCLVLGKKQFILRVFTVVRRRFTITTSEINEPVDFIGCWIRWEGNIIKMDQQAYVEKILARHGMEDCKEYPTPMSPSTILYPAEDPVDFPLREWNGSLMFCRFTRYDLLYAINQFSRVLHAPSELAVQMVRRCFGYLKATKTFALSYYPCEIKNLKLAVLTDAEWAANVADRKSVGGDMIYFGPSLVAATCKTQTVVAPSTQSSEVIQVFVASKKIKWIKHLLEELGFSPKDYKVPLLTDSTNAVRAICTLTDRSKHLGVYLAYVRDLIRMNYLSVHHVKREDNYADMLTKQDSIKSFQRMRKLAAEPFYVEMNNEADATSQGGREGI